MVIKRKPRLIILDVVISKGGAPYIQFYLNIIVKERMLQNCQL